MYSVDRLRFSVAWLLKVALLSAACDSVSEAPLPDFGSCGVEHSGSTGLGSANNGLGGGVGSEGDTHSAGAEGMSTGSVSHEIRKFYPG